MCDELNQRLLGCKHRPSSGGSQSRGVNAGVAQRCHPEAVSGRWAGEGRPRGSLTASVSPGGHGQGQRHPPLQGRQRPPGAGAVPGPRAAGLRQLELPADHRVQVGPQALHRAPARLRPPWEAMPGRLCCLFSLPPQHMHTFPPRRGGAGGERCWRKTQERKAREMAPHFHKINGQPAPAGARAPTGTRLLNEMPFSKCHPNLLLV